MENDLFCPTQMRMNDVELQECPKFMGHQTSDMLHTLRVRQDGDELNMPLGLCGATSCFPTRKPTRSELARCQQFDLTLEEPGWDPQSTTHQEQEDLTVNARGTVHGTGDESKRRCISSVRVTREQACGHANRNSQCSAVLTEINPNLHNDFLLNTLESNVKVSSRNWKEERKPHGRTTRQELEH